jgi:hypothetical protein
VASLPELPKQLSGVYKLMQMMDWEGEGRNATGMVEHLVNFNIGKEVCGQRTA